MKQVVRLVQGSDEWHRHRALFRNASETAAVMGLSPWQSSFQLWEIKTGRRAQEVTLPMQRGIELEPKARAAYEAKTGNLMEPVVMTGGDYSASLDGLSFDGELVLEVKCPFKGRESSTWVTASEGRIERHYEVQVQHQLMVSKADRCDFWVFDGRDGIVIPVNPKPDLQHAIRTAWDEFWKYVATDSPPPLTGLDTVVREDYEWKAAAASFIANKQAAETAAARLEEARARLSSLAHHTSERGFGVAVSKFWRGPKATKEEVRVTVLKPGEERC